MRKTVKIRRKIVSMILCLSMLMQMTVPMTGGLLAAEPPASPVSADFLEENVVNRDVFSRLNMEASFTEESSQEIKITFDYALASDALTVAVDQEAGTAPTPITAEIPLGSGFDAKTLTGTFNDGNYRLAKHEDGSMYLQADFNESVFQKENVSGKIAATLYGTAAVDQNQAPVLSWNTTTKALEIQTKTTEDPAKDKEAADKDDGAPADQEDTAVEDQEKEPAKGEDTPSKDEDTATEDKENAAKDDNAKDDNAKETEKTNKDTTVTEEEDNSVVEEDTTVPQDSQPKESFARRIVGFFTSGAETKATGKKSVYQETNLPAGFSSIKLTLSNKEGGYKQGDTDLSVDARVDVTIDDAYTETFLEQLSEGDPNYPQQAIGEEQPAYEGRLIEYLEKLSDSELPPITYTYSFGDNFEKITDGKEIPLKPSIDGKDVEIGTLRIPAGEIPKLEIKFNAKAYVYYAIRAGEAFDLTLNGEKLEADNPVNVGWEDGKVVLETIGTVDPGSDIVPWDKAYTLTKEAPANVKTPYIDYTVNLAATGSEQKDTAWTLNGKKFSDTIPAGLEFPAGGKLQVSFDGGDEFTDVAEKDYTVDETSLTYTIPDEPADLKTAVLKFRLAQTPEALSGAIGAEEKPSYTNQASLADPADPKKEPITGEVTTTIDYIPIQKEGSQNSIDGTKFSWTLKVNTFLPDVENAYVIDTLDATQHKYYPERGVDVYGGGRFLKNLKIEELTGFDTAYNDLTVDMIAEKLPNQGNADTAYYYTSGNAAILMIPFNQFKDQEIQIKYTTDLNLDGYKDLADYIDKVGDIELSNIANIIWKNKGGDGPGTIKDGWGDIGKDVASTTGVVSKQALNYDEKTRQLGWKFAINQYGVPLDDVTITDTFDDAKLSLNDAASLSYKKTNKTTGVPETGTIAKGETGSDKPYYTITDADGGKTLSIYFGAIPATDYYEVWVNTTVNDPNLLVQQGNAINTVVNTANYVANISGKEGSKEEKISAEKPIKNTLIKKAAVGDYDYSKHEFTWEVTVNPNQLTIQDARVIDTLPAGNNFGELKSAVDSGGNSISVTSATSGSEATNDVGQEVTFSLGKITDTITLTFTSVVTDDYRIAWQGKTAEAKNHAALGGTIDKVPIASDSVFAEATNEMKSQLAEKGGVYDKEEGKITWSVLINREGVSMADWVLNEDLTQGGSSEALYLDTDSVKIEKVIVKADGSLGEKTPIEKPAFDPLTSTGFRYQIPKDNATDTLLFTFDTYLTDSSDAFDAKINNKVTLTDGSSQVGESNESDGGYTGDFNYENYVQAAKRPCIQVVKVSANSTGDKIEDFDKMLPLPGAEFSVTGYTKNADNDGYTKDDTISVKPKTTRANGAVAFASLRPDTVYQLAETKAPSGYDNKYDPTYFMFCSTTGTDADQNLSVDGATVSVHCYYKNEDSKYTGSPFVVTDLPTDSADFQFTKQVATAVGADGVATAWKNSEAVTFELKSKDDPLKSQTVTSDTDGVVKFQNVDPGEYTLTETAAPDPYQIGGTLKVVVSLDKEGEYSVAYSDPKGLSLETDASGKVTVKDDYARAKLTLTKHAAYENKDREVINGVTFTLTATSPDTNKITIKKTTANNGKVVFSNLPAGTYTLTETRPAGYANPASKTITVKVENNQAKIYNNDNTVIKNGSAVVDNAPVKGKISFTKQVFDSVDGTETALSKQPLGGVEFGLFRVLGGTTAKTATYTTTSSAEGKVAFSDVEYGNYILKETKTPAGYTQAADIEITKDMLASGLAADGNSFTYVVNNAADSTVKNTLIRDNVAALKLNQDGSPLADVTFDLQRRGGEVASDYSGFVANVDGGTTTYSKYAPQPTVTSDADGNITISHLPYGDYRLAEQNSVPVIDDTIKDFDFTVREDGIHWADNLNVTVSEGVATITNQLKYGFAQIHKTGGEKKSDGDMAKTNHALAGVTFAVYQGKAATGTPYLTLKTDAEGRFTADTDGSYTDSNTGAKKHLYFGEYTLQETSTLANHHLNTGTCTFTIGTHQETAYISSTATGSPLQVKMLPADQTIPTDPLYNEVQRGSLLLQKQNGDGTLSLDGGKFTIYDGKKAVAAMEPAGETGRYCLASGGYKESKNGVNYLYNNDYEWKLLAGDYTLKETKAPAGYTLAADLAFTVTPEGTVTVGGDVQTDNTLILKDAQTAIQIVKQDEAGVAVPGAELSICEGVAPNGTVRAHHTFTADETWTVEGLVAGQTYTLYESVTPPGYTKATPVVFTLTENGKIEVSEGIGAEKYHNALSKDQLALTMRNLLIRGHAELTKTDNAGNALADVAFNLYQQVGDTPAPANDRLVVENLTTDANGVWTTVKNDTKNLVTDKSLSYGLTKGTYYFVETATTENCKLDATPHSFTVTDYDKGYHWQNPETYKVAVKNDPYQASVTIHKYDATSNAAIAGTGFTLSREGDTSAVEQRTNEEGDVTFTLTKKGDYTLTETAAATGYQLPAAPFTATFTASDLTYDKELTINRDNVGGDFTLAVKNDTLFTAAGLTNERILGTVKVKKVDSAENIPLEGAIFTIYQKDASKTDSLGNVVASGSTGSDGGLVIKDLPWGEYILMETVPPPGYVLTTTPYEFTINAENLTYAAAFDTPVGNDKNTLVIEKQDASGIPLSGAKFELKDKDGNSQGQAVLDIDANTWTLTGVLTADEEYTLTEVTAPNGYELPGEAKADPLTIKMDKAGKITIVNADNGYASAAENKITVKDTPIAMTLSKTDMAGDPIKGATFSFAVKGEFSDGTSEKTVTESNMSAVLEGQCITGKTYTLTETAAPYGYKTLIGEIAFKVKDDGSGTLEIVSTPKIGGEDAATVEAGTSVKIKNEPIQIQVKKSGDNNEKINATFKVTGSFAHISEGTLEKMTPTDGLSVSVTDGAPAVIGKDFGTADSYTVMANETYTLTEATVDGNFIKLPNPVTFSVDAKGKMTLGENPDALASLEDKGVTLNILNHQTQFKVEKVSDETNADDTAIQVPGAELTIFEADGSTIAQDINGNKLQWTSDGKSKTIQGLAAGDYILRETKTPVDYCTAPDISFTLNQDNTIVGIDAKDDGIAVVPMTDVKVYGQVKLTKTETGTDLPLGAMEFSLYKENANPDKTDLLIAEGLTTDANGVFESLKAAATVLNPDTQKPLSAGLHSGTYYFKETKTDNDHILPDADSRIEFTISRDNHYATAAVPVAVNPTNDLVAGSVTLFKYDEVSAAGIPHTEFQLAYTPADASAAARQPETATYTTGSKGDTVNYTDRQGGAQTYTYDKDGMLFIPDLGVGHYVLTEKTPALDYQANTAFSYAFDITAAKSEIVVKDDGGKEGVVNARVPGTLVLEKIDADDESQALDGVVFDLYQKEEADGLWHKLVSAVTGKTYTLADTVDPKDAENGVLTIKNLAWGSYYIVESRQLDGYVLDETKHEFTIEQGHTLHSVTVEKGKLVNSKTDAKVNKVSPSGTVLNGAELTLTGKFADQTQTKISWTSGQQPQAFYGQLLTGETYTLTEAKAPDGYILLDKPISVKMGADGLLKNVDNNTLNVLNQPITLQLQKKSPTGEVLKGCVFSVTGVFAPAEAAIKASSPAGNSQAVSTIIVDDQHPDALTGRLIAGNTYELREVTPPAGYEVGGSVKFTVNADGSITLAKSKEYTLDEKTGSIVMVNDPVEVFVEKQNAKGTLLDGAEFKLTGTFADGSNEMSLKPTAAKPGDLSKQLIETQNGGKEYIYTLTETKAPNGYQQLSKPILFKVLPGGIVKVTDGEAMVSVTEKNDQYTMHVKNVAKPQTTTPGSGENGGKTPNQPGGGDSIKTGDDSSLLGTLLLGLAALAVAFFVIWRLRRKRS